ncbi:YtrH family sporulation protein [Aneurinibacillus uraniidurans]|uniref:YtrH family sporulation protein n=1 Tax=Aneurinibacillus uraniidurans TaxID=2966586 RepID=UPI002349FD5A|nr:YtrH family sporulation protein [Aneurinibacillus sp. B1]WCN37245.1 YtrH family sporulation protein [Aneurinibacillus sp. B1]
MNQEIIARLISGMVMHFFVAYGIVLGGSIMAGIAAVLTRQPPFQEMADYALKLKIWGLVGALDGTFDSFLQIEKVFAAGSMSPIIRQIIFILSAFMGADTCTRMVRWLVHGDVL